MNSLSENMISTHISSHDSYAEKLESGEFLFSGFTKLFNTHPSLADIHREFGSEQKLRILCYQLSEYPILIEAIKISAYNQQTLYQRSLFCSWLCFLIAGHLKLSVSVTKELFIAALVQDLAEPGGDHLKALSAIFSSNAGSLSDSQKGNGHEVTVSRFLETVPRLPDGIKLLVRSHHERFDGTGFPDGKVEQQLSIPQQVLIVTNEVAALCYRDLINPFNLSAILPILKLNASVYFRSVFSALIRVITPSSIGSDEHQYTTVNAILDMQNQLTLRWPHLLKATAEIASLNGAHHAIVLTQMARRAWMLVTTAGILSDDLSLWLSQLGHVEQDGLELEVLHELDLLLDELNTMMLSYQQQLEAFINDPNAEMSESKRSLLIDLCHSIGEQQETFDLDEFTILNMCD